MKKINLWLIVILIFSILLLVGCAKVNSDKKDLKTEGAEEYKEIEAIKDNRVCQDNLDCFSGEICENSVCVEGCEDRDDCFVYFICKDSKCVEGCEDKYDCSLGEFCNNNKCVWGCGEDFDCFEHQRCSKNKCVDNIILNCVYDADCDFSGECVNSHCEYEISIDNNYYGNEFLIEGNIECKSNLVLDSDGGCVCPNTRPWWNPYIELCVPAECPIPGSRVFGEDIGCECDDAHFQRGFDSKGSIICFPR